MSKVYVTKNVPAFTRQECIKRKCDLCHKESDGEDWGGSHWNIDNDTTITMQIKQRQSNGYGYDGGNSREIEIDLCPHCFEEKLVKWLQREGAKIAYEENNW